MQVFDTLAGGGLLVVVLGCVVVRPRGLSVSWPAGIGAVLAVLLGLLSPSALAAIFGDTWDAAATLIALFLLAEALNSNGFFTWAALHLARVARGSGWRLYLLMLVLTVAVTALLANDGAVLMLTPIFAVLLTHIYPAERNRLPFIFAAGFFADAMSGLFVPSNLTNIIVADATHLSFARVAVWMALPTLAAFLAGGAAFALRFRSRLGKQYDLALVGSPEKAIHDWPTFWAGWGAIVWLVVGYIVGGELHLPVSLVAASAALAMLLLVQARHLRPLGDILTAAPWNILVYALGMFVVITAAFDTHVLDMLTQLLRINAGANAGPEGAIFAGVVLALLSSAVNNLPATLIGVLALHTVGHIAQMAIYAMLLGVDIGPKLTPFGSLATLLWLGILRRHGIEISWGQYLRENWWVVLVVLGAAFGGLLVANILLG